ncbi:thiosulfate sulfurtransferase 16, chloroplastic [Nymphaea colorata]|nr:thiosulfate sulfurtransferase 16, chloroplastic [Nymphaea colorata]
MSIVIRARSATRLLRLLPSLQTATAIPSVYARSLESPPCLPPFLPTSQQPFFCPQPHSPFALLGSARPFCSSRPESAQESQPEASTKSVPVHVAHELLQAGHRYLDVRTAEEFNAGHPIGAINIPYMFKNGEEMTKNPKFLEEVSQHFGEGDQIIVGCKSGRRSLLAASDMLAAGYSGVTDVSGGYTDWVEKGFPTN